MQLRIEGYAIVSDDGMLAAADGVMPSSLKIDADQQFLSDGLDRADIIVHGRHSHEGQPQSPQRRRLIVTRRVATLAPSPDYPNAVLWNPAGIAGMEKPRSGKVLFQNTDIAGRESHEICNLGIGQVAEGRQIFPSLTVLENLQMGAMLPRARAAASRNLENVLALFPRLAERRHQLAGTMSGGEQQMVAIGRCLMGAPELIMFDEPSLGLAPLVVQEVLHTIRVLNERGLTILLVEQNVAVSLKISSRACMRTRRSA